MEKYLIIGLGNKGIEYANTRHNLGRKVVEKLGEELGAKYKYEAKFQSLYCTCQYNGRTLCFLLPETYMNESGGAVLAALKFFKLPLSSLIVVVDDCALDFGNMRVRMSGSSGGHNGLKNIEQLLGSRNYLRLRIGIGKKRIKEQDLGDYVLQKFSLEEQKELPNIIQASCDTIKKLIFQDFHQIASAVNKKQIKQSLCIKTTVGEKQ